MLTRTRLYRTSRVFGGIFLLAGVYKFSTLKMAAANLRKSLGSLSGLGRRQLLNSWLCEDTGRVTVQKAFVMGIKKRIESMPAFDLESGPGIRFQATLWYGKHAATTYLKLIPRTFS